MVTINIIDSISASTNISKQDNDSSGLIIKGSFPYNLEIKGEVKDLGGKTVISTEFGNILLESKCYIVPGTNVNLFLTKQNNNSTVLHIHQQDNVINNKGNIGKLETSSGNYSVENVSDNIIVNVAKQQKINITLTHSNYNIPEKLLTDLRIHQDIVLSPQNNAQNDIHSKNIYVKRSFVISNDLLIKNNEELQVYDCINYSGIKVGSRFSASLVSTLNKNTDLEDVVRHIMNLTQTPDKAPDKINASTISLLSHSTNKNLGILERTILTLNDSLYIICELSENTNHYGEQTFRNILGNFSLNNKLNVPINKENVFVIKLDPFMPSYLNNNNQIDYANSGIKSFSDINAYFKLIINEISQMQDKVDFPKIDSSLKTQASFIYQVSNFIKNYYTKPNETNSEKDSKISQMFSHLNKGIEQISKGKWDVFMIPLVVNDHINEFKLLLKKVDDESNNQNLASSGYRSKRFVFEFSPNNSIKIWLDCLFTQRGYSHKKLDLILRSSSIIDQDTTNSITKIFNDIKDLSEFEGDIKFISPDVDFESKIIGDLVS